MEKACELLGDIKCKSYDIAYYIATIIKEFFQRAFKGIFWHDTERIQKWKGA